MFDDNTWLSRTRSYASYGHVPIFRWHYRDFDSESWPHADWIAAPKRKIGVPKAKARLPKHVSNRLSYTKTYLKEKIGIDVDELEKADRSQSSLKLFERLDSGDLGFFGAFLSAKKECFLKKTIKKPKGTRHPTWEFWEISVADQKEFKGEFRFDDGEVKDDEVEDDEVEDDDEVEEDDKVKDDDSEAKEVNEFVAIVAADKISNPFNPRVFFLGLVTREGISTRVGIGFINFPKPPISPALQWQYKFFRIR